jgi:hypothetical protein
MCCGQKRTELRNTQAQSRTRSVPQHTSTNSAAPAVRTPPAVRPAPHTSAYPQTRSVQARVPMPTAAPQSAIHIRYLETSPIRVRGLVSGKSYDFSGSAPIQQVDARDAASLLNTRFFRRA